MSLRLRRAHRVAGSTAAGLLAVCFAVGAVDAGGEKPSPPVGAAGAGSAALFVATDAAAVPATAQRLEKAVTLGRRHGASAGGVSPKGTRLWRASAVGSFEVPEAALRAYRAAAATTARTRPACDIPWTLLAAIGRVESDHGRFGGSVLGADGVARPRILGLPLNGVGPVAAIPDTDGGRYDGDKVWDRAVGPMQFIPSTWAASGRDGDGDGTRSPNDIDDAALAAAGYVCPASGSIRPETAMRASVFRYNASDYYVDLVLAFEQGYRTGAFEIPSPPPPAGAVEDETTSGERGPDRGEGRGGDGGRGTRDEGDRPQHASDGDRGSDGGNAGKGAPTGPGGSGGNGGSGSSGGNGGSGGSGGNGGTGGHSSGGGSGSGGSASGGSGSGGSTSSPSPTPPPAPTPTTPSYVQRSGTWQACGPDTWCLGGIRLDLGPASLLDRQASADHDGANGIQTNREELAGLEGRQVTVTVQSGTSPAVVVQIGAHAYRNADGSYT